jgi:multiple sugar transport system permease protein
MKTNAWRKAREVLVQLVLALGAVIVILPFLYMFFTALKTSAENLMWPPRFLPQRPTLSNYAAVFEKAPFGRFFLNSLIVAVISTFSIVTTSVLGGVVFAKYRFRGRRVLLAIILSTALLPVQSYVIPLYLQIVGIGLLDRYLGIAAPLIIMSLGIFIIRQVVVGIPDELLDAARIDGAGDWYILTRIFLPLIRSPIAAVAILAFRNAWMDFFWPLIVTRRTAMYTMELGTGMFQFMFVLDMGGMTAAASLQVLPILVVFIILRRQIIESVASAGLKG